MRKIDFGGSISQVKPPVKERMTGKAMLFHEAKTVCGKVVIPGDNIEKEVIIIPKETFIEKDKNVG